MSILKKILFFSLFISVYSLSFAQTKTPIDGIIAIVGKETILISDLEKAVIDYKSQDPSDSRTDLERKCQILEQLVLQKLFVHQADLDSVFATPEEIEYEVNSRINYFIRQVGGNPKIIEQHFNKTMDEIKSDMREILPDQILVQKIQSSLTSKITITPTEVKRFFDQMNYDELPLVPAAYEYGHIVKFPPVSEDEIKGIKDRLMEYRERVLRGEKFSMLARLYSDDPGSAPKGGDIGFVERGSLYPEFEAAAFKLKSGEISPIVQTKAGYHIIQLIERKGEAIHVAHILIQPKPSIDEQVKTIGYLDSIKKVIVANNRDFSEVALLYSDDPNRNSGGWVTNPSTLSVKFDKESLDPTIYAELNKLIPGEYSEPLPYVSDEGVVGYRVLYLKTKTTPHKPNMVEDYDILQNAALENRKNEVLDKWVANKVKVTSIKINDKYRECPFVNEWQIP
ncbi:MAG: peptidylprolyl isomerase [Bacteroidales bacterium]|jgi:peptidyl-prolyl cis-trans isomerase SurA|nr:peptidylprolyl isomerase [Bacteroidales bacterium]